MKLRFKSLFFVFSAVMLLAGILLLPPRHGFAYGLELADGTQIHDGSKDIIYNASLYLANGEGPFNFTIAEGSLPPGTELYTDNAQKRCFIQGYPSATGVYSFSIRAEDSKGNVGQWYFSIKIVDSSNYYTVQVKNGVALNVENEPTSSFQAGRLVTLSYEGHEPQFGCKFRGWIVPDSVVLGWVNYFHMPAENVQIVGDFSHRLTVVPFYYATCTEPGCKGYYICQDCQRWFWDEQGTVEITNHDDVINPPGGHSLELIAGYAASCTEAGLLEHYECMECYAWFWDAAASKPITEPRETYLEALGHSFGPWIIVKEASLTETGLAERVCQHDASHKETQELPKLTEGSTVSTETDESSTGASSNEASITTPEVSTVPASMEAQTSQSPAPSESTPAESTGEGGGLGAILPWLLMLPLMLIIGILGGIIIAGKKNKKEES